MGNGSSAADESFREACYDFIHENAEMEDGELWDALFSPSTTFEVIQQELPLNALRRLWKVRPRNIQNAAIRAVSTISRFMETKYQGPEPEVALSAARFMIVLMPVLLEDESANAWCWEEHRLAHFLTYLDRNDKTLAGTPPRHAHSAGASLAKQPNGGGWNDPAAAAAVTSVTTAGGLNSDDSNGQDDDSESEFPICLAGILLHTTTNMLFFPGVCVDPSAPDLDDEYAPVPEHCYGIRDPAYIWYGGAGVADESVLNVSHFDANRLQLLRLHLALLARPLYLPPLPPQAQARSGGSAGAAAAAAAPAVNGNVGLRTGVPLDRWAKVAAARHLPFSPELFYSLLNVAMSPEHSGWSLQALFGGGSGGGGGRGLGRGGSAAPSVPLAALQLLLVLLQHGSPFGVILKRLGVDADALAPHVLPQEVREQAAREPDYNCHRCCLWTLHGEDFAVVAEGIAHLLEEVKAHGGRGSQGKGHEALLLLAALLNENPHFAPYICVGRHFDDNGDNDIAGSGSSGGGGIVKEGGGRSHRERERSRGKSKDKDNGWLAVELFVGVGCCLDMAATSVLRGAAGGGGGPADSDDDDDLSSGEDVGLLQLCAHILLRLSQEPGFGMALDVTASPADLPRALPSFQGSHADALVLLACDVMAHPSLEFVCPALAGAVRNVVGVSSAAAVAQMPPSANGEVEGVTLGPAAANALIHTIDLLTSRPSFLKGTAPGVSAVSMLVEAVGLAIAADYSGQAELVLATVRLGAPVFNRLRHRPSAYALQTSNKGLTLAAAATNKSAALAEAGAPSSAFGGDDDYEEGVAAASHLGPWLGVQASSLAALGDPALSWPMQRVVTPLLDMLGPRLEAALPPPPPPLTTAAAWSRSGAAAAAVAADEESALQDIESDDDVAVLMAAVRNDVLGRPGSAAAAAAVSPERKGAAAPVRARLEGWHFSYLWSVLFVRTQEEGIFPPHAVRLFELEGGDEEEEGDVPRTPGSSDGASP